MAMGEHAMTDDIVARLRAVSDFGGTHLDGLWTKAADEIERLRALVPQAYKEGFSDGFGTDEDDDVAGYWEISFSRAALKEPAR